MKTETTKAGFVQSDRDRGQTSNSHKRRFEMKKRTALAVLTGLWLCLAAGVAFADADFHIGIVTSSISQAEDSFRAGQAFLKKYGDVKNGGMVTQLTTPDNFTTEMETTISQIVGLSDDPKMKVIVVDEAIIGTMEAFRRVRERRPDIILLAGEAHEDPSMISKVADMCVMADNISRGYTIIYGAKLMGAKTFVHISFPRHLGIEVLSRRMNIMKEACADLGLTFVQESAPDPTSDVGVAGAQQYVLEKTPAWIEKYGKDTCFFSTNQVHLEPLFTQITKLKAGYFLEGDSPSPLKGYPGAFHLDLTKEKGDWMAIKAKIEKAVVDAGAGGRLGAWTYSASYSMTLGLGEFGKAVVEGRAKVNDTKALVKAMEEATPGVTWKSTYYRDKNTGVQMKNYVMLMEDSYVYGKGYLHLTDLEIPEKYYKIK